MCCPYFIPARRHAADLWPHRRRLPLGEGFTGCCSAPGHEGETPADSELKDCNLGYAPCFRLPPERACDAIRFSIARDAGPKMEILYVCEVDHLPGECGTIEFSRDTGIWTNPHGEARIQSKAECFLKACLNRRKG